jgi:hypothetical protein
MSHPKLELEDPRAGAYRASGEGPSWLNCGLAAWSIRALSSAVQPAPISRPEVKANRRPFC